MSTGKALASSLVIVVVGALVAAAGSHNGAETGGVRVFLLCAIVAFALNWAVFVPSYVARTEHWFDLTGSITYLTLVVLGLALGGDVDTRSLIIGVLVATWALRLGSFLFLRIRADGSDGRFDKIKVNWARFLMTWTLQGLWVLLTLACGLAAMTAAETEPIGVLAFVGIALWVVGFAIEAVADAQKRRFRADPANEGRFITTGLWAWSRHPNYFGEITLWVGIALIALPALSGWQYATLISPVFVYLLLTRISGLPMLESRAKRRWGDEPEFQAYKRNTPVLVPRPPR